MDLNDALLQLPRIQKNLSEINDRLGKLDVLEQITKDIKEDLWGVEGLDRNIKEIAELSENNEGDIHELRAENKALRRELDLLKSVVIKMDRKIASQGEEITELKARSMRDNILIHNFEETENENLAEVVPRAIKEWFKIDVDFVRIHRNGSTPNLNGKPRTITGKLMDRQAKFEILRTQRSVKKSRTHVPFAITPQSPPELYEKRKQLEDVSFQLRENNVKTKFVGDKLVLPDGSAYRASVMAPRAEDVLTVDIREKSELDKMEVVNTRSLVEAGNKFKGSGMPVKCIDEVRKMYKKVVSDASYAGANHNVLVYRTDEEDGFCDDSEFGAGKRLLNKLRQKNVKNVAIVISRWYIGRQIGPKRFEMMEQVLSGVLDEINNMR